MYEHKAQPVTKIFSEVIGVDYIEIFEPVAMMNSIRLTLAIGAAHGWVIHQIYIKSAFIHRDFMRRFIWSSHRDSYKISL